jgi:hypothetical protein
MSGLRDDPFSGLPPVLGSDPALGRGQVTAGHPGSALKSDHVPAGLPSSDDGPASRLRTFFPGSPCSARA